MMLLRICKHPGHPGQTLNSAPSIIGRPGRSVGGCGGLHGPGDRAAPGEGALADPASMGGDSGPARGAHSRTEDRMLEQQHVTHYLVVVGALGLFNASLQLVRDGVVDTSSSSCRSGHHRPLRPGVAPAPDGRGTQSHGADHLGARQPLSADPQRLVELLRGCLAAWPDLAHLTLRQPPARACPAIYGPGPSGCCSHHRVGRHLVADVLARGSTSGPSRRD